MFCGFNRYICHALTPRYHAAPIAKSNRLCYIIFKGCDARPHGCAAVTSGTVSRGSSYVESLNLWGFSPIVIHLC